MKSAIGLLLFLVGAPMHAELLERAKVLSVDGQVTWGVGIHGQAVGFALSRLHHRVTVSARLGNGGGHAYVDAFLVKAREIGPDTTEADEVARTSFDLAFPYDAWTDIFTDLELEAGTYWLVIGKPKDRAHSSINWFVARPEHGMHTCTGRYIGSRTFTFLSDAADYLPASKFEKKYEPYRFQIEVTELRAPGEEDCP